MQYLAVAVANTLLDLAREAIQTLDQMKLQKLVYFAHGWHIGLTNNPLIREDIEAWDYGPVVPALYQELKRYGAGPITDRIGDLRWELPNVPDPETRAFLRKIWDVYGGLSAIQLSDMTHRPDSPWTQARSGIPIRGRVIPESSLREYFKKLSQQNVGFARRVTGPASATASA